MEARDKEVGRPTSTHNAVMWALSAVDIIKEKMRAMKCGSKKIASEHRGMYKVPWRKRVKELQGIVSFPVEFHS